VESSSDVFVADWRLVFDFADEDFGRAGLCFGGGFDGSSVVVVVVVVQ
jgi:hypothetical protein